jgi:ketosteroid isomerase-like protein
MPLRIANAIASQMGYAILNLDNDLRTNTGAMTLDASRARALLNASHAAWCRADVEGVLAQYVEDLTYWCNTGGADGLPLTIKGRDQLREFLQSITAVAESMSVTDYFRFEDGVARASVECYIRHKRTGHVLAGSYRQVVTYRDGLIERVEEYHDAAKMAAFWRMIAGGEPLTGVGPYPEAADTSGSSLE